MPHILELIDLRFMDNCLLFECRLRAGMLTHLLADFAIRQMALEAVS